MITLVSAYILKQKGIIEDTNNAHNKIAPKSKLKKILADYPTTFEQHLGIKILNVLDQVVTYKANIYRDEVTSFWRMSIVDRNLYAAQIDSWILHVSGGYRGPGSSTTHDIPYLRGFSGNLQPQGVPVTLKVETMGGTSTDSATVTDFALVSDTIDWGSQYPISYATESVYPISISTTLPVFSSSELGVAYASAATAYHQNPTEGNYDTVCGLIDQAMNPDG